MREQRYLFLVTIRGIGSVKRIAHTAWQAIDIAYSEFSDRWSDRKLYSAKKIRM